jgi:hypothetical protein
MASIKFAKRATVSGQDCGEFKASCVEYRARLHRFQGHYATFSDLYDAYQSNDTQRRASSADHYRRFQATVKDCPKQPEAYLNSQRSGPTTGHNSLDLQPPASPSGSNPTFLSPEPVNPKPPPKPLKPLTPRDQSVFPRLENGWNSPSTADICACLEELCLIFFWDVDKRTFCGIAEDDPDVEMQKVFLLNVIHFLTLFSEFTGALYDVRISMADGFYKLEDRVTGVEIKQDTIVRTIPTSPYRAAVFGCLAKIAADFHVDVKGDGFVALLDAILQLHKLLV